MYEYKEFFKELNAVNFNSEQIRWKISNGDSIFWNTCVNKLKDLGVNSVLDIGAGYGEFVELCLNNGMDSYGIEPRHSKNINNQLRVAKGTIDTTINFFKDKDVKFDCVSILNFLHGKHYSSKEIVSIFDFLSEKAKYVILTYPNWNLLSDGEETKQNCRLERFKELYSFPISHGGVYHFLLEVICDE